MTFRQFYMKRNKLEDIDDWGRDGEEMSILYTRMFDTMAEFIDLKFKDLP